MAQAALAASAPKRPVTYRALGRFWAAVGVVAVAGIVILQILGPVPKPAVKHAPLLAAVAPRHAPPPKSAIPPPDPALLEKAPDDVPDVEGRSIPQVATDGRTPMATYAAPFDRTDKHPRVALIISGVGQDQALAQTLLTHLPGAIDVAFSPYLPNDRADQVAKLARDNGHECLLTIPMEPNEYPTTAGEGPKMLLSSGDSQDNSNKLVWALSRFGGCIGATGAADNGMMGERFAQTDTSFGEMVHAISNRKMMYLDPKTGAGVLYNDTVPGVRIADVVISSPPDQPLSADAIDQQLDALTQLALRRGTAIGVASPPTPVLLDHVALWANQLASKGVTLAPLTAIPSPTDPSDAPN
ncbi:MAG TPA: divergent polysaccharide deacetylase family protein [Acetobacteraceae bacterium]|nr:divergent polysaccharide deacetylase family protein [Acetobacteraceae bacterium]